MTKLGSCRNFPSSRPDRKSTRLNSSHTEIYTLSLHDALPIYRPPTAAPVPMERNLVLTTCVDDKIGQLQKFSQLAARSEEHTSELQSHRDLHSFPTRRSSDLSATNRSPCSNGTKSRADDVCG